MLEFLQHIDEVLFFFINNDLANPFLDWLMPLITRQKNWYPLFFLLIMMLLWKGGKKGRLVVLLLIPVILLSDQISSTLIKPLFDRVRPCKAFETIGTVNMLIGMKTSPSFPSSHAANSFAAATLFALFYSRRRWIYYTLAAVIAFSRVYVGVHYPFDVLAGALIGFFSALLVYYFYDYLKKRSIKRGMAGS